ncbi:MAG: hypothetical protein LUC27_00050, partial [Lachnospiraceae bacterium]|nr:hypothetical protein [Lachnospiraceae bacterium]
VDEAEKLNVQAQNALLKTLEEPPGYGVILLITVNAGVLLPTIRSRSICLELASGGSGLELLEEEQRRQILSVLKKASDCDRTELAAAAAEWKEAGIPFRLVLHLIRVWFRDILVWKDLGQDRFLILKEEVRAVREAAERYSYPAVQRILELTDRTERRIASNVNYELAMELLLAALRVPEKQEER